MESHSIYLLRLAFSTQHNFEGPQVVKWINCPLLLSAESWSAWSGCSTVHVTVHPLKDIWGVCSFELWCTELLWTFVHMFLCENIFCFLWDICPKVPLLGHMVSPPLAFRGTAKLLSSNVGVVQFLPMLASFVLSRFFILAIPVGVEWDISWWY